MKEESAARLGRFLLNAPIGICCLDTDLRYLYINTFLAKINGLPVEEHVGRLIGDVIPEVAEVIDPVLRRVMQTGEPLLDGTVDGKTAADPRTNRAYLHTFYPDRSEDGTVVGVWCIVRDITEGKRLQDALTKSERDYRDLFQHAPSAYFSIGVNGRINKANLRAAEMLGHSISDLIDRPIFDFYANTPAGKKKAREVFQRFLNGEIVHDEELEMKTADGKAVWISLTVRPVRDAEGKIIETRSMALDITERKQAERERKNVERQLLHTQKLETLGVLSGGFAHDFNNLLMGIMGRTDLALAKMSPHAPGRDEIEPIEALAQQGGELCNQLLAYAGRGKFVISALNLSGLVKESTRLLEASVSKSAALIYDLDPALPTIEGDTAQLRQIILNLIINASEAVGENEGVITVTTSTMHSDEVHSRRVHGGIDPPRGTLVYLEVSDNGCGMDEETQKRMFDPFYTTKFTGRGLGLAAVLGIVHGHKGVLEVESNPGHGTTVKVCFPSIARPAEVRPSTPKAHEALKAAGTVLLVDDEEMVRKVTKSMIESLGFHVLLCKDGLEAVEVFRDHANEISLVLLDLTMPKLSGRETFHEIRRIDGAVRVLLTSGYAEEEANRMFARDGLSGFIQKPYGLEALKSKLGQVLRDETGVKAKQ